MVEAAPVSVRQMNQEEVVPNVCTRRVRASSYLMGHS